MRKSIICFSLTLFSALIFTGSALALDASIVDDGGNNVTIDSVTGSGGNWNVAITEEFLNDSSIWTEYNQTANNDYSGEVYFEKCVTNSSNLTWRDFHMKLWVPDGAGGWEPSPNNDGLYFTGITLSGPFGQTWYDPNAVDELWLWNGIWNDGQSDLLSFSVGGWGWDGSGITGTVTVPTFRLQQWPTETGGPSMPEPSTLLLMIIGAVGVVLRKHFAA